MDLDRRSFLASSLMTVAVFGRTPAEAAPAPGRVAAPIRRGGFNHTQLRHLVGTRFQLRSRDWHGHLQLTDVVAGPSVAELEQFTAVFRCENRQPPAAGVYDVAHPEAGRFQLRIDGRPESSERRATFALLRA